MAGTNAPAERGRRERSRGRRVLTWAIVGLVLVVALLWLLWGFRWPPTAEVVDEPPEVSRLEARQERERPPEGVQIRHS